MRVKVDREADALYFRLDESRIVESEEIRPGVIVDYNEDDQVVGLELLDISKRTSQEQLSSIHFSNS